VEAATGKNLAAELYATIEKRVRPHPAKRGRKTA
jgi:hypothetical protein